jgi:nitroimidazol reductase NimA-like FMN-containing flavoprotein (pyridoxamine 5'-phosphate oxidase superfamily)
MQGRMKEHPLSEEEISALLLSQPVGNLGTLTPKGFPYITPVHYVVIEDKIYIHGLFTGQKIDYIKTNPKIGFEVFKLNVLIHDPELPCETNTDYQSVIILGTAKLINDDALKIQVLDEVVKKYTPQHSGKSYPPAMLKATGVIEITPSETSGKFFK